MRRMSSIENFTRGVFFCEILESCVSVAQAGMPPGELVELMVLEWRPLSSKPGDDGGCSLKFSLVGL